MEKYCAFLWLNAENWLWTVHEKYKCLS